MAPQREHACHEQLRRFRSERGDPLDEQELVEAELLPSCDELHSKGFRCHEDDRSGCDEQRADRNPPRHSRKLAQLPRHSDQLRLAPLAVRSSPQVDREDGEQHDSVVPGETTGEGDDQRIEAGESEECELELAAFVQLHAARPFATAPKAPREQERDERPAQSQQQPIAAGHVRRGVMRVLRNVPRAPREVEIDGVLGEDGDHREDRGRETPRDVALRGLGCPHQQERRRYDRGTENQHPDDWSGVNAENAQRECRNGDCDDDGDLPPPGQETSRFGRWRRADELRPGRTWSEGLVRPEVGWGTGPKPVCRSPRRLARELLPLRVPQIGQQRSSVNAKDFAGAGHGVFGVTKRAPHPARARCGASARSSIVVLLAAVDHLAHVVPPRLRPRMR